MRSPPTRTSSTFFPVTLPLLLTAPILLASACVGIATNPGNADLDEPENEPPSVRTRLAEAPIRRLTRRELVRTASALLRVELDESLLPEDTVHHGFDNQADALGFTPQHAAAYQRFAERAAELAMLEDGASTELLGCDPVEDAECLAQGAAPFLRRFFRRPATPAEVDRVLSIADEHAESPLDRARVLIEVALQSPHFILRPEFDRKEPQQGTATSTRLSSFELLTRLAFLLWGQGPDDAALDWADGGELDSDEGLERVFNAMISDPRAEVGLEDFAQQWLSLDRLRTNTFDPDLFPEFDDDFRSSMEQGVLRLVGDFMSSESPFVHIHRANYAYANTDLAPIYGMNVAGAQLERVDFPVDQARSGIIGTAGFLALTSRPASTSPVQRGLFVQEAFLCRTPPAPPPGVENTEAELGQSAVEAAELHLSMESCRGCHEHLDPIGWGLDRYGPLGSLRERDEGGQPVRQVGYVLGEDVPDFGGASELGDRIATSEGAERCFEEHLQAYALGASGAPSELMPAGDRSFREILFQIVKSETFRSRPNGGQERP